MKYVTCSYILLFFVKLLVDKKNLKKYKKYKKINFASFTKSQV